MSFDLWYSWFSAVDFFNQVNLLYGTLTEFCTPEICPTMTAGPKYVFKIESFFFFFYCLHNQYYLYLNKKKIKKIRYEYRWADGVQIKKPIEVSAPKYVEFLMDWIESQLDDESIFPQRLGIPFTTICLF